MPAEGVKRPGACLWLAAQTSVLFQEMEAGLSRQTLSQPGPPGDKAE